MFPPFRRAWRGWHRRAARARSSLFPVGATSDRRWGRSSELSYRPARRRHPGAGCWRSPHRDPLRVGRWHIASFRAPVRRTHTSSSPSRAPPHCCAARDPRGIDLLPRFLSPTSPLLPVRSDHQVTSRGTARIFSSFSRGAAGTILADRSRSCAQVRSLGLNLASCHSRALPYAALWTPILRCHRLVRHPRSPAIVVYSHELVPGRSDSSASLRIRLRIGASAQRPRLPPLATGSNSSPVVRVPLPLLASSRFLPDVDRPCH